MFVIVIFVIFQGISKNLLLRSANKRQTNRSRPARISRSPPTELQEAVLIAVNPIWRISVAARRNGKFQKEQHGFVQSREWSLAKFEYSVNYISFELCTFFLFS